MITAIFQIFSMLVSATESTTSPNPTSTDSLSSVPTNSLSILQGAIDRVEGSLNIIFSTIASLTSGKDVENSEDYRLLNACLSEYIHADNLLNSFATKRSDDFRDEILKEAFSDKKFISLFHSGRFPSNLVGSVRILIKKISFFNQILNQSFNNNTTSAPMSLVDFIDKAIFLCLMASENVKAECSKLQSDILKKTDDLIALAKTAVQKNSIDLNTENMKKFNVLDLDFILNNVQKIRLAVLSSLTRQNTKQIVLFRNTWRNHSLPFKEFNKRRIAANCIWVIYRDIVMNLLEAATIYIRLLLLDISDAKNKQLAFVHLENLIKAFRTAVSSILCMTIAPHENGYNYKKIHEFADKIFWEIAYRKARGH